MGGVVGGADEMYLVPTTPFFRGVLFFLKTPLRLCAIESLC